MGYWIYPVIFVVKIIEVAIASTRIILMTKGKRMLCAALSIAEVTIWLLLVSTVISNIQDDPLRMVVYVLGCAIGIYFGSSIEERLALGHSTVYVIVNKDEGEGLTDILRNAGFGLTSFLAQGRDDCKVMILLHVKRKRVNDVMRIIEKSAPSAILTVSDSKTVMNGYSIKKF